MFCGIIYNTMKPNNPIKIIAVNKKAGFNYFLSEFTECGIVLKGTEIKSLRKNSCNITDSYVVIRSGEAEILNMHIPIYKEGNIFNHDPMRTRTLLLHKKEIKYFETKVKQGGFTIVPTKIYFRKGKAKVEIALAKGKKLYDKREDEKRRDDKRAMERAMKDR